METLYSIRNDIMMTKIKLLLFGHIPIQINLFSSSFIIITICFVLNTLAYSYLHYEKSQYGIYQYILHYLLLLILSISCLCLFFVVPTYYKMIITENLFSYYFRLKANQRANMQGPQHVTYHYLITITFYNMIF